jgi:GNAT superfamily N-acetyltransferase
LSSRHGLSIRAADSVDVEGIAELLATASVAAPRERLATRVAALLEQPGVLLVADEWGPPSGIIAVHWHAVLTSDLKLAEVSALYVDPARRRNGIARLLLKAASQAARSAKCGALAVNSASPELAAFCLASGFGSVGEVFTRPLLKK